MDSRFLASGGKQVPLRVRGKGENLRAEVRDRPPPSQLELRPLMFCFIRRSNWEHTGSELGA